MSAGDAGADEVHLRGVAGPNLVAAALAELRAAGWAAPALQVEIGKRIPVAAGHGRRLGRRRGAAALRPAAGADRR